MWDSATVDNLAEELGLIKVSNDDEYTHTVFWSLKEMPKYNDWVVRLYKDTGELQVCTDFIIEISDSENFYTLNTGVTKPCKDVDTLKSYIKNLHIRYDKKYLELKKRKEMFNLAQIKKDFV